jgi:DNA (cytosine-5)-methyltransferase 1
MTGKPRLLDLFCGAGGAAMGYSRAGFEVVGVDIKPQPHYPFEFHQGDARFTLANENGIRILEFAAIHASPPCQDYSLNLRGLVTPGEYPRLIPDVRDGLTKLGLPWIIENVEGAPLVSQSDLFGSHGVLLCGTSFGLRVRRHRLFETSFALPVHPCRHAETVLNPYDAEARARDGIQHQAMIRYAEAMGIDWMTGDEASEAIPPAYTEWIGHRLLEVLG